MHLMFDHAASTPPRPEARAAFERWLDAANASAVHASGQAARIAVEAAREQVAAALRCSPHEVVFTSGGTEADNLAIKGIVWAARDRAHSVPHLVTTAVEHPAVLQAARWLAERGDAELTEVPPDPDGRVPVDRILEAVRPGTCLVSVMAANNELGAINDLAALGPLLRERGVPLHTDAVQAMATLDVDVEGWCLDAVSISGHKLGAPQGVGAAVLRRGLPVVPLSHGGGQDRGVRSGTFAAALDAALGAGIEAAVADRPGLRGRLRRLGDRLADGLCALDGVRRNGPTEPDHRLASHVHVSIDGVDQAALTLSLDLAGVAVSSGSACGAGAAKPSPVVEVCGLAGTPVRLSLGWTTTEVEVEKVVEIFADVVPDLRKTTPAGKEA